MPSLSAKLFSSQNFSNIHSEKNHSCPKKRFLTFFLNAVRSPYLKGPMWNPSPQTLFLPLEFVCLSNSITHSFQIGPVNKTSSLSVRRQSISAKFASWYPLALVSSRTTSRPNSSREMKHDMYVELVLDCVHERIYMLHDPISAVLQGRPIFIVLHKKLVPSQASRQAIVPSLQTLPITFSFPLLLFLVMVGQHCCTIEAITSKKKEREREREREKEEENGLEQYCQERKICSDSFWRVGTADCRFADTYRDKGGGGGGFGFPPPLLLQHSLHEKC